MLELFTSLDWDVQTNLKGEGGRWGGRWGSQIMGLASQRAIHLLKGRYERRGRRFYSLQSVVVVSTGVGTTQTPPWLWGKLVIMMLGPAAGPARTEMMRNYLDRETIKLRISK